jgi:hypothetical protein
MVADTPMWFVYPGFLAAFSMSRSAKIRSLAVARQHSILLHALFLMVLLYREPIAQKRITAAK